MVCPAHRWEAWGAEIPSPSRENKKLRVVGVKKND